MSYTPHSGDEFYDSRVFGSPERIHHGFSDYQSRDREFSETRKLSLQQELFEKLREGAQTLSI